MNEPEKDQKPSIPERLKVIGGLIAVGTGVVAVALIAGGAIIQDTTTAATIASSAGGVIASIVGAYFGVKVGSDQTKSAHDNQKEDAAKAQVYAAHLSPQGVDAVLDQAQQAAEQAVAA